MAQTAVGETGGEVSGGARANPAWSCDLVMRGGITSGVIYPPAITRLAETWRLRSIGGTSAGAIAAAAAAAAEYRRQRDQSFAGFDQLASLSTDMAQGGRLVRLFKPQRSTRGLFDLLLAVRRPDRGLGQALAVLLAVFRIVGWGLFGPLVALLLGFLVFVSLTQVLGLSSIAANVIGTVIGVLLFGWLLRAMLRDAFRRVGRALVGNHFGLTRGYEPGEQEPGLTAWLHETLQEVAGKEQDEPLTFGDLWHADGRQPLTPDPEQGHPDPCIDLRMVTTNLTHGLPHTLPYLPRLGETLAFDPKLWKTYFPDAVVDAMSDGAEPVRGTELLRWPAPEALPVVVAVRMSLSFPFLISAVPLRAIDYSRRASREKTIPEAERWERVWFSDGGITSNFPIHFFDAALPSRPTFGINLRGPHIDHPVVPEEPAQNVFMVDDVEEDLPLFWHRIPADAGDFLQVGHFAGLLVNAVQNWNDTAQLALPGFRDRVVHIAQAADEGGLNLEMSPATIQALEARGRAAAERVHESFPDAAPVPATTHWNRHRWARLRSTAAALDEYVVSLLDEYGPDGTYAALVQAAYAPESSLPYALTRAQWRHLLLVDALPEAVGDLDRPPGGLQQGAPRPRSALGPRPRY